MRREQGNSRITMTAVVLILLIGVGRMASAQGHGGQLFPSPFLVEHHIVQTSPDGSVFATEPTVDHYSGSLIVSLRADGSRLIVDFAKRSITEVRPDRATYTVLSFDQMVELQRRLRAAERAQVGLPPEEALEKGADNAQSDEPEEPAFAISEVAVHEAVGLTTGKAGAEELGLLVRQGVRHLRVELQDAGAKATGKEPQAVDVWVDPSVRLGQAARDALGRFESEVLAGGAAKSIPFSRYVAEVRNQSGGAFPIRTARPLSDTGDRSEVGIMEDIATRLEPIEQLSPDLVKVPEGYKRAPHPLEQMVAFAEEEAALNMKALQAVSK